MSLIIKNAKMPVERVLCPCYHLGRCWATDPPCDKCSDHPFPCEMLEEIEIEEMRGIELLGAGAKDKISARI